ncbi:transposase [Streptococcus pneumoniae]|nr:transposase [Streptococcus pneumoniae]
MSWDEYAFTKGKMSFIAQDFNNLNIITVLEGRTQAVIRDHFLKYDRAVRCRVKIITMDMFSPYYGLAKQLRFHIVQHLSRAMSRVRVQIMNQFHRKSHEYKAIKRYWKLIQQDSRKLSDKQFYRPTFRMHLTNKEILNKLLSYSEDLKHHYQLYQLLLFHFQNKEPEKFFRLSLKPSSKIKKRLSTPFNYTILMPNWKRPIISSNLSSAMPLVFETLKTSKNGFSSL